MKKTDSSTAILWIKRLFIYLLGLYCMAIGVVLSARSNLGVSPVGSLANVFYQIGLAEKMPDFVNLGNCTMLLYVIYILAEILILRRDFKPLMFLQLIAAVLFGQLVNLAGVMLAFLPDPANYGFQLVYIICSIPMVAVGVMCYLSPNLLPTPGDGMSIAISKKSGLSLGTSKVIFDCTMVVISAVVSLLYFHKLVGVREGTVICALFVGMVLKQMQKLWQESLLRFVERENKVVRAIQETLGGFSTDSKGRPKVIVTIGREFGAGGEEIGERLAKRLGIEFYHRKLNVMAAEQSGIPLSKVEELESHKEREIVRDFKTSAYAMTNDALSPEEELFVAQAAVIRQIAARDESCVILGRCADFVLYDDPNCFRIFVHARPHARIARIQKKFNLSYEEAKRQIENTDRARAQHYRHFTGREYGTQKYYYLGIDSGIIGIDESVEVIIEMIRRWCDVRGTHPLTIL